jgi:hypothetical protein
MQVTWNGLFLDEPRFRIPSISLWWFDITIRLDISSRYMDFSDQFIVCHHVDRQFERRSVGAAPGSAYISI